MLVLILLSTSFLPLMTRVVPVVHASDSSCPIPQATAGSFTLFWITDTQYLSRDASGSDPKSNLFVNATQWIANNWSACNGKMVIHTGDIVDTGSNTQQWTYANDAMSLLLGKGIPYTWDAGNHDGKLAYNCQNCNDNPLTYGWIGDSFSSTSVFNPNNQAVTNEPGWVDITQYSPDGMSTAVTFSGGAQKFLVINIGFAGVTDVTNLDWVSTLISQYPNYQVIIATHAYLNPQTGTTSDGDSHLQGFDKALTSLMNSPGNSNVFLTLNGHYSTDTGYHAQDSTGSRWQLMFDRQEVSGPSGQRQQGAASVTTLTFDPSNSEIAVNTFNTLQGSGSPPLPGGYALFSDHFTSDSGAWTYLGTAQRDTANHWVVLTQPTNGQAGVLWFNEPSFMLDFNLTFRYKIGGGTGADGIVAMFFKQDSYTGPTPSLPDGGSLAWIGKGYGVEWDTHYNPEWNDPGADYVGLVEDSVGNHLGTTSAIRDDDTWHTASIQVTLQSMKVYIDSVKVLQWNSELDRTYEGLGFSGATGAQNDWQIITNVSLSAGLTGFSGTNLYLSMNAPASMDRGNPMTYTMYYDNFGDTPASNAVLSVTLPSNVNFVTASDGGTYDSSTATVTWSLGSVPAFPTGRGSETVTVNIAGGVTVGTVISAASSIRTDTSETRYDDNTASAQTTVTGFNLPPNVGVGPTVGNTEGTPVVFWGTPTTFTYHDATATGVSIRIHFDDGGPDILGSMGGRPPDWTYTTTFYPRHGLATVTYTITGATPNAVTFPVYDDPAGYVYDVVTGARVSNATVWLQEPDGQGGWVNVPTGQNPPIMQPDVNPQITSADGQFQWDVLGGSYLIHVEAAGYYPVDSIVVTVPPAISDLQIGLTQVPSVSLSPSFGAAGTSVTITGTGLIASHAVTATFGSTPLALSGTCTTSSTGTLGGCTFTVPPSVSGPHTVMVTDGTNSPIATFAVLPLSVSLSPSSGIVGTPITITGAGFVASRSLTVTYDGSTTGMPTTCSTNSLGNVNPGCAFTVPLSSSGPHTVEVSDGTNSPTAKFAALPLSVSLSPSLGAVDTTVTIAGIGFLALHYLTVTYDGSSAGMPTTCTTKAFGNISSGCIFMVPTSVLGPHVITVSDGTNSPTATFTVTLLGATCPRTAVAVGSATTCRATVHESGTVAPTGSVTWSSSGPGTFSKTSCRLSKHRTYGTCSVKFTPTAAGSSVVLTANYGGDSKNPASAGVYSLVVNMKASKTTVSCKPRSAVAGSSTVITCKAKVKGYLPTGAVSWSQSGPGSVIPQLDDRAPSQDMDRHSPQQRVQ